MGLLFYFYFCIYVHLTLFVLFRVFRRLRLRLCLFWSLGLIPLFPLFYIFISSPTLSRFHSLTLDPNPSLYLFRPLIDRIPFLFMFLWCSSLYRSCPFPLWNSPGLSDHRNLFSGFPVSVIPSSFFIFFEIKVMFPFNSHNFQGKWFLRVHGPYPTSLRFPCFLTYSTQEGKSLGITLCGQVMYC